MKPLILDFKISRMGEDCQAVYEYDTLTQMNTVTVNGEKKPFIDCDVADVELMTKTKVHMEKDDSNILFELGTKTEVKHERDDPRDTFLELVTKTFVKSEADDQRSSYYQ